MTPDLLDACTGCGTVAIPWAVPLTSAMNKFSIDTPRRMAAFLAQIAHESDRFTCLVENLNYSAAGLLATWPEHFNTANAGAYAYHAQAIANHAYANRMGNGDEASGDGWAFRGRGPIQTTGRDDYRDLGSAVGFDLVAQPDLLIQPGFGSLAAAWEWNRDGLNVLADAGDFEQITRRINGGLLGEPDRLAKYQRALAALGAGPAGMSPVGV